MQNAEWRRRQNDRGLDLPCRHDLVLPFSGPALFTVPPDICQFCSFLDCSLVLTNFFFFFFSPGYLLSLLRTLAPCIPLSSPASLITAPSFKVDFWRLCR